MKMAFIKAMALTWLQARMAVSLKQTPSNLRTTVTATSCNNQDDDEILSDQIQGHNSFGFSRLNDEGSCIDVNGNSFVYGEYNLNNASAANYAQACADTCVNVPKESTLEKLVGFNLSCEEEHCYCLYSAPLTQKERKRSGYDRIRNNPGIDEVAVTWGEVVGTKTEPGMNCYALVGHSTSSPGKWTDDLNDDVAIA